LLLLTLGKITYNFEFSEMNISLSLINLIFIIFVDILSYSSNLLYILVLPAYLFFKNKFSNSLTFKIENLGEKSQRIPDLLAESHIKKHNVIAQNVADRVDKLSLPLAQSERTTLHSDQLSYLPKSALISKLLILASTTNYHTTDILNLHSEQGTYISCVRLEYIPCRRYHKFVNWELIRYYSPRHIGHLNYFRDIKQKTKVYKGTYTPTNGVTLIDLDRTFNLFNKYISLEKQSCLGNQLRSAFNKNAETNYTGLEDTNMINPEEFIGIMPNGLPLEEINPIGIIGVFDPSVGLNIADIANLNNACAENLHRVDANYELSMTPMPSRIEVSVYYDPITQEPSTDVIKYYNSLNNNLMSTITKPVVREELNSNLNNAISNITVELLNDSDIKPKFTDE